MMSKGLIVILACSAVVASPITKIDTVIENSTENALNQTLQKENPIKSNFNQLLLKISEAIVSAQKKIFDKIGDRLNSEVFTETLEIFSDVVLIINENIDELKDIDEESQKILKKKEEKVAEAFTEVINEALKTYEQGGDKAVNAENFRKAVGELKEVVYTVCEEDDGSEEEVEQKVE